MGNLLFSPSGRIGPSAFLKGMGVLAIIGAIISLLPLVSVGIGMAAGFIALLLYIPAIFMGIKRSHDSGKSGWFVLVMIVIGFVVSLVLSMLLMPLVFSGMAADQAAVNAAAESGDMAAVMELAGEMAKSTAIPSAVSTFVATLLTAFLFNLVTKQDGGDNQFGPVPAE